MKDPVWRTKGGERTLGQKACKGWSAEDGRTIPSPPAPQHLLGPLENDCISAHSFPLIFLILREKTRSLELSRESNKQQVPVFLPRMLMPGEHVIFETGIVEPARATRTPCAGECLIKYKGNYAVFFQPVLCWHKLFFDMKLKLSYSV